MQILHVKPLLSRNEMYEKEGHYFALDPSWKLLSDGDVDVIAADTGQRLCCIRRGVIPVSLCRLGVECYKDAGRMISTNRGTAAGLQHRERREGETYERGAPSNSGIVGFMDSLRHDRPCRLTAFSREHFDKYTAGLPFIHAINQCFSTVVPEAYAIQRAEALKSDFHIEDTAFSTVTVNLDFRTALHRDSGDFPNGFGNLVVCSEEIEGGHLLLPRYGVAILLRTGDFLALDVHEWHCNSEIHKLSPSGYRLSFVCYLRNRMSKCGQKNARLQGLENVATNSNALFQRIFRAAGEDLPERRDIGAGPSGIVWWEYEGVRYKLTYRNKRYTLFDKTTGAKIANLWPAVEYAEQQQHSSTVASK